MGKDLLHGLRTLWTAKGWTAVVVVSLALGIGANTAIFSAANGLLLKKLPVRDPDSLVRLKWTGQNDLASNTSDYGSSGKDAAGRDLSATFSYPMFQQFVAANRTMTELFACAPLGRVNLAVDGRSEIASSFLSTGNYYRVLGVTAHLGRVLTPEDDRPAAPPVAVVSHRYWRSRFGGDPRAVGKVVRINDVPVTIVGVLPPEHIGVQQTANSSHDVAVPLALDPLVNPEEKRLGDPTNWWLQVMGRVRPGVSPRQVEANLEPGFRHTARTGLDAYLAALPEGERSMSGNRTRTEVPELQVDSGSRGVYDAGEREIRALAILAAVVALVLLIVCANVANLLLSRAAGRQKELSVRLALGATRGRLVRQLLTESLLLAAIGGALGVVVGRWGQRLLPGPVGQPAPLDGWVLAFALAVTALTGLAFGIAPALKATGVDLSATLQKHSRSVAGSRSRLGKALLVVQVSVSVVLLVGAGLFLRTVANLRSVDVGFNPENLVLFRVDPQLNRYDEPRTRALYGDLLERLRGVGGVRAVALSQSALLSGSVHTTSLYVQGRPDPPGESDHNIHRLVVSSGFFEALEMPVLAGRGFTERDHATAPKVVVINQAAARQYFPREMPLGRRLGGSPETSGELEIVGVLSDAKYNSVRDAAPPTMYVPYLQQLPSSAVFEVRTAGDPLAAMSAIRTVVRQVDPNLPLMDLSTQNERIEQRFQEEKTFARACTLFGGLASLLAAIGLFGVMSLSVARRTGEIGVRLALGAERRDVLGKVLAESMAPVAAGVAIGLVVALAASRFVAALLFGLEPTDAVTLLAVVTGIGAVSAVAAYLPARRASRVDPIVALRSE